MDNEVGPVRDLAVKIAQLLADERASGTNGSAALATLFCMQMLNSGISRAKTLETFENTFDLVAKEFVALGGVLAAEENYKVEIDPQAQAAMDADPKKASFVRDVTSRIRQAMDGLNSGRFSTMDEAMESIGAKKITDGSFDLGDDDDDDVAGHA